MDEYIEREAALNLFSGEPLRIHYPDWYAEKIKALPAADVAPVVRCKDCAFSQLDGWLCGGIGMMPEHPTFPDSFCENGIRKDGDDHA